MPARIVFRNSDLAGGNGTITATRAKSVAPRRQPHQARSARRVEEIFVATAGLLEKYGPDNLTTNHIAAKLGISVGTLYHYFPNKHAILYAMAVNWLDEWQRAFDEIEAFGSSGVSIEQFVDDAIDRMLVVYRSQRGLLHLVQSMFTIPELRRLDTHQDKIAIGRLSVLFKRLGITASPRERQRLALVYLKLSNTLLLEAANRGKSGAGHTLDDLKQLLCYHLTRRRK